MSESQIERAVELLKKGQVVGIPTETVYGLAALISSPEGISRIFSTKKRPFFDPLIVHVSSKKMAETLTTDWSPVADFLAEHFWPGPLTMVLPKSEKVDPMITSGLETVGIRMPKHSLALSLIDRLEEPLAAPSANLFGKTSPTTAEHVRSEFKEENLLVIDGGACEVGLESTVLLIKRNGEQYQLSILRAGHITQSVLEKSLTGARFQFLFTESIDRRQSPGQMKHHYMPEIPLVLVRNPDLTGQDIRQIAQNKIQELPDQVEGVQIKKVKQVNKMAELVLPSDPALAARLLYSELRRLSENKSLDLLFFKFMPEHGQEPWLALMDRLTKAASLILQ